jgi:hypothetical protein
MSSLIGQVGYSLSSSGAHGGDVESNAFSTTNTYFFTSVSPYYWQISFSKSVTITGYSIGAPSDWGSSPTSWEVSYSVDGSTFTTLQTYYVSTLIGKKFTYQFDRQIYCKHFRITGKSISSSGMWLAFNQFDCYGTVGLITPKRTPSLTPESTKIQCTVNVAVIRRKLISQALLTITALILSSS